MTILKAHVPQEKWHTLQAEFKRAIQRLDPGIAQTFLLHQVKDPSCWRIATVWESREALDAMRASGATPRGVLIFRAANAEPTLSILDVTAWSGT